jgi:hypothetical protein
MSKFLAGNTGVEQKYPHDAQQWHLPLVRFRDSRVPLVLHLIIYLPCTKYLCFSHPFASPAPLEVLGMTMIP